MRSDMAAALAENTKILMTKHGWSQRDLAKKAGTSQAGVGYLLRYKDASDRHATVDTVEALGKAFGVPAHMLLVAGYAAAEPRNVVALPAKKLSSAGTDKVDRVLLDTIVVGVGTLKRLSAANRARLTESIYDAIARGDEVNTKTNVLRLVTFGGRLLRSQA